MAKFNKKKLDKMLSLLAMNAQKHYGKQHYDRTIHCLSAFCYIKYTFYYGYSDAFVEDYIKKLSMLLKNHEQCDVARPNDMIVFYDSFTSDNKALTEQYLDALIANDISFVYLHKRELKSEVCKNINKALLGYKNAKTIRVPNSLNGLSLAQWIYDTVSVNCDTKLLMQLHPYSIEECVAFSALPDRIKRYQINLTDHTFWAGSSCSDYALEFRHYGCNLSLNKRGFSKEQILLMPFYPVMKSTPFQGFPFDTSSKVLFFSGGAPYKVVNPEMTFFNLCKHILEECPNSIIAFAGGSANDTIIVDAIAKFGLKDRMYALGYRSDIFEVFKRCDIYINTFPFGGGLMCQYAAQCSKPILNFHNNGIEQVISQKQACQFTSYSLESFLSDAKKLYFDEQYRRAKGQEINSAVITVQDFNNNFITAIYDQKSTMPIEWELDFSEALLDQEGMIDYQNTNWNVYYGLYARLGGNLLKKIFPKVYIYLQVHRILKKIKLSK